MKKKFLLLFVLFITLFSFNIKVDAASKEGTCVYNGALKVKLYQSDSGEISYYYYSKKKDDWVKIKGKKIRLPEYSNSLDACPRFNIFKVSKLSYAEEYKGFNYIIKKCTGTTGCVAGTPKGYFDKLHNTSVDEVQVGSCVYKKGKFSFKIDQKKSGKLVYSYKKKKGDSWTRNSKDDDVKISLSKTYKTPFDACPGASITKPLTGKYNYVIGIPCANAQNGSCVSVTAGGNFAKKTTIINGVETYNGDINEGLLSGGDEEYESCEEILGEDLVKKIQEIVNIVRIMVPILLIVFGIMDFGKAIFVSDENEMKKAQSKFIKRLIIAVAFFIIPSILQLLLNIASKVWDIQDPSFCGITFDGS